MQTQFSPWRSGRTEASGIPRINHLVGICVVTKLHVGAIKKPGCDPDEGIGNPGPPSTFFKSPFPRYPAEGLPDRVERKDFHDAETVKLPELFESVTRISPEVCRVAVQWLEIWNCCDEMSPRLENAHELSHHLVDIGNMLQYRVAEDRIEPGVAEGRRRERAKRCSWNCRRQVVMKDFLRAEVFRNWANVTIAAARVE